MSKHIPLALLARTGPCARQTQSFYRLPAFCSRMSLSSPCGPLHDLGRVLGTC